MYGPQDVDIENTLKPFCNMETLQIQMVILVRVLIFLKQAISITRVFIFSLITARETNSRFSKVQTKDGNIGNEFSSHFTRK